MSYAYWFVYLKEHLQINRKPGLATIISSGKTTHAMKNWVPFFLILLLLVSCSREPPQDGNGTLQFGNGTGQSVNGTVMYKLNGEEKVIEAKPFDFYENVILKKEWVLSPTTVNTYSFHAGKSSVGSIGVKFRTDHLNLQSYTFDSLSRGQPFLAHGYGTTNLYDEAEMFYNGDFFTIRFTSLTGGRASGTFSAKLSRRIYPMDYALRGTFIVTDGVFTDIPFRQCP
jgi:hypothetical protein